MTPEVPDTILRPMIAGLVAPAIAFVLAVSVKRRLLTAADAEADRLLPNIRLSVALELAWLVVGLILLDDFGDTGAVVIISGYLVLTTGLNWWLSRRTDTRIENRPRQIAVLTLWSPLCLTLFYLCLALMMGLILDLVFPRLGL